MTRRLHGLLRRLLPADFRAAHGAAMESAFRDALEEARAVSGRRAAGLWLREAADLAATGRRLRAERRRWGAGFVARRRGRRAGGRGTGGAAMMDDLRYAVRSLVRRPTLTLFAALTIALGVGATTAIFSTLEAVILNPLPYEGADRMVSLMRRIGNSTGFVTPAGEQLDLWREQTDLFETVEAWTFRTMTLGGQGEPREVQAGLIRPSFHDFVGRPPLLGRAFDESETVGSGARVALLSHTAWQSWYGGDAGVLGRSVELDGESWTIVGVMPRRTLLPAFGLVAVDVWRPLSDEALEQNPSAAGLLREGVTVERVNERLEAIGDPAAEAEGSQPYVGVAQGIADQVGRGFGGPLGLLMGAVVLLLLIACVNVSNLLLFRATARRRETAVRSALGSGPLRLVRQLLMESVLLALVGGALGVAMAVVGRDAILALRPERLEVLDHVGINGRVLAFALVLTLGTGLLFGLLPALDARRTDAASPLRSGARIDDGLVGGRARWLLVAGEVALSFALLIGSLSILSALRERQRTDVGYRADEVAVMQVTAPSWRYETPEELRPIFEALVERVAALPGVAEAAVASGVPPRAGVTFGVVQVEGSEPGDDTRVLHGPAIDAGYFSTLGQRLLAGRTFTPEELADDARVAVIGEGTAQELFGGDAVGRRFRFVGRGLDGDPDWTTVVGVAEDVAMTGLSSVTRPLQMYHPRGSFYGGEMVLARAAAGTRTEELLPLLRQMAGDVEAELRIDRLAVAEDLMAETLDRERFTTTIMGAFALLALVLAAIGLYGVVSQVVGQRTREIGIRMALGAGRGSIASIVLRRAGGATVAGIALGAVLAAGGTRILESRVFGLQGGSAATFAAAALLLAAVAALAAWMPARRATRVDPVAAMRTE